MGSPEGRPSRARLAMLDRYWTGLVGEAWEELCRHRLSWLSHPVLGEAGTWKPAGRWWRGHAPEWDLVAEDVDSRRLLLGEVTLSSGRVRGMAASVGSRPAPELPPVYKGREVIRAVFVPETQRATRIGDVAVVSLRHLIAR